QVLTAETRAPLAGAFVTILDGHGAVVRSGLTNESGTALFVMSIAGRTRVQAELIGRATRASPLLALHGGRTEHVRLLLPLHAVSLDAIRVEAEEQCRIRPDHAEGIARVWESVRTSLRVQAWTEQQARYRLEISSYERDLDAAGRTVERESRRTRSRVTRTPFRSVPPAELASGFVRSLPDGGHEWLGADAALLLSDEFLNSHCFGLARSPARAASIGLTFAPADAARPDIAGTLWLDDRSGRLEVLEYRYTAVPQEEARGLAGGRAEFEALPDGSWIIRSWWIRAPVLARDPGMARAGDAGIRVVGVRETGGEVVSITSLANAPIREVQRGTVAGIVWDSTRAAPLADATVYLGGTAHAGTTDATGRFELRGLAPGVFTAGFTHPRLDELGIEPAVTEVEVSAGDTAELRLAIPSLATILVARCRAEADSGTAVVSGIVSDRRRGGPVPGATVRVQWQQVERMQPVVQARDRWFEVRTDTAGRYIACGVPVDEVVTIRASLLARSGAAAQVSFARPEHGTVNLTVELPVAGAAATVTAGERSGSQGVQGILTDHESGGPVRAAAVTIRNSVGDMVGDAITDDRGFFRVHAPLPGRYVLSADALGYRPLPGEALEIARGRLAILEKRTPRRTSDVLLGVPGILTAEPANVIGGRAIYFRGGIRSAFSITLRPNDVCWPMVYIDRQLVSTGGLPAAGGEPAVLDDLVPAAVVQAIEVYRSPAEVPSEFNGPNAGCG
ncbi:MAG TPA: carboxypeptidase regulatory-like domain-containing protein, partial [Longimicrobiales bacterium]